MTGSLPATLVTRELSADRWADLETLFGERGACGGCWCMWWRLPRSQFNGTKGDANRDAFHEIVERGPAPGLIAYDGGRPVGWCAIGPRDEYPVLNRSRVLAPLDHRPVWSITCFFVERRHRKMGISTFLVRQAVAFAAANGAELVEGYPIETRSENAPAAFIWTGTVSAFRDAGFTEAARRSETRPIMRLEIPKGTSLK